MRVDLGSIEVDDEQRRLIRRHVHGLSGLATRAEVRDFALAAFVNDLMVTAEIEAASS